MTEHAPAFADIPDDQWTDIEDAAELIVEAAAGRLDALTGRLVHVVDDLDGLARNADRIVEAAGRTLTLRTYGSDDPLGS